MKTGLDDGPLLPSRKALERAYAKIESRELHTDTHRINWLESLQYFQVGINSHDGRWQYEIRWRDKGDLKRFFGRSFRAACDAGMDHATR